MHYKEVTSAHLWGMLSLNLQNSCNARYNSKSVVPTAAANGVLVMSLPIASILFNLLRRSSFASSPNCELKLFDSVTA